MELRYATGPVTWGVDFADSPNNPHWSTVLDEIAASGIGALELGPIGYLPTDGERLRHELADRGLIAVGSFVFDNLHDRTERPRVLRETRRAAEAIAIAGGSTLVIIDQPGPVRAATAGRSKDAPRLDEAGRDDLRETLELMAATAVEHGLDPAVHPHAGGYIEFADEIEWVVADTTLNLCLDTGHLAYAGIDPAAAILEHGSRVTHLHLKDVSGPVLAQVRAESVGFWAAIERGVFCPLGTGLVGLPDVLRAVEAIGYTGYATIEQDRVPGSGDPLSDLQASVDALRSARRAIQSHASIQKETS